MTDAAAPKTPEAQEGGVRKRTWAAFVCVLLLIVSIASDITIVDAVLPNIITDLGIGVDEASLAITLFLAVAAAFTIMFGKFADRQGRKTWTLVAGVLLVVGSAITASAVNAPMLFAGRIVQGLGTACLLGAGFGLLNVLFPPGLPARPFALGAWSIAITAGTAIGPVIGGAFAGTSWRYAFVFVLAIGVIGTVGVHFLLDPTAGSRDKASFDVGGTVMLVISLGLIVVGVSLGSRVGWLFTRSGDTISYAFVMLVVGLVLFATYWLYEFRRSRQDKAQLLPFEMLKLRSFYSGAIAAALMTIPYFGMLTFIPLYTEFTWGYTPLLAGLLLAAFGVGGIVGGRVSGHLLPRFGSRHLAIWMIALQFIAIAVVIPILGPTLSGWFLVIPLAVFGFGWSIAYSAALESILAEVPPRLSAVAGSAQAVTRFLSGAIGTAILVAVFAVTLNTLIAGEIDEIAGLNDAQRETVTNMLVVDVNTYAGTTGIARGVRGLDIPEVRGRPNELITDTKSAYTDATRAVVIASAIFSLIALAAAFLIPHTAAKPDDA